MTFYGNEEVWGELTAFIMEGEQQEKHRWYVEMGKM